MKKINTREEFERYYAENSKMTVERVHEIGLYAVPCHCNESNCRGWQMLTRESMKFRLPLMADDERDAALEVLKGGS